MDHAKATQRKLKTDMQHYNDEHMSHRIVKACACVWFSYQYTQLWTGHERNLAALDGSNGTSDVAVIIEFIMDAQHVEKLKKRQGREDKNFSKKVSEWTKLLLTDRQRRRWLSWGPLKLHSFMLLRRTTVKGLWMVSMKPHKFPKQ